MPDITQRTYGIVKQCYPTTPTPYFVIAHIVSGDSYRTSHYAPGFVTLEAALASMSTMQTETANQNDKEKS